MNRNGCAPIGLLSALALAACVRPPSVDACENCDGETEASATAEMEADSEESAFTGEGAETGTETETGTEPDEICEDPVPCGDESSLGGALGIGCQGPESEATFEVFGDALAHGTTLGLPGTDLYAPRLGTRSVALGTGWVEDFETLDPPNTPSMCSRQLEGGGFGEAVLPEPINPNPIDPPLGCLDDPSLVGQGDCSATLAGKIASPFEDMAVDFKYLRISGTVPTSASALSLDLAFLSCDYPEDWLNPHHDFPFVWFDSTNWSGNILYSEGEAVTLRHSLFSVLDAQVDEAGGSSCPGVDGCSSDELSDTLFEGHGATPWLRASVPVEPGASYELIVGIHDRGNQWDDSFLLLDRFSWSCEHLDEPTLQLAPG